MPIIPSVFQPIKQNDVQQRPFKAYKRYKIRSVDVPNNTNGFFIHNAVYRKFTPHIFADTGLGVGGRIFPVNSFDNTNQHIVWNTIDFRYYRDYNATSVFDYKDKNDQERFLWYSASILTIPYHDLGERAKKGTFFVTSSIGFLTTRLRDDGDGNLIDPLIDSSKFASSSRNFFHLSFNNLYRKFEDGELDLEETQTSTYSGDIEYQLNHHTKIATINHEIAVMPGIQITGSIQPTNALAPIVRESSGLCARFPEIDIKGRDAAYIRIPNDDKFERFGRCDSWTISFWHRSSTKMNGIPHSIMTKWGLGTETIFDQRDKKRKLRDKTILPRQLTLPNSVEDFASEKIRTPLHILHQTFSASAEANTPSPVQYMFFQCDGTDAVAITGSTAYFVDPANPQWTHIAIKNENEVCKIYIDGSTNNTTSGSLPHICINNADIMLGAINGNASQTYQDIGKDQELAEVRFYDYAVSDTEILSLANNNYLSASCYQTDVVGNVFHRNGQVVASSPLPQYTTGSGIFGNTWNATYRGTHTIYENEVLVRVPKDTFNVTMNPTANYRPATVGEICAPNHQNVPTGELRKPLFVSGTLKPYITTIGLYDDESRMLAIGKLSTPVQKLDDVDMNFIVRWDY